MRLRIYEPPRFFEALLRGRGHSEPPDITARICGICPVAYQMSACAAIEDACGVQVDEPIRRLRRLIYCGEWIESHTLHVFMLHAPDVLGYDGAIVMARDHRGIVERGLQIKKAGNAIITAVGGWEIHPINVRVGGFYRAPRPRELRALVDPLERARELALQTVRWTGGLAVPDFERGYEFVALSDPHDYPTRARPARLERRARHRARRVRGALRRGARPALDRPALAAARWRHLPVRAPRALRAELGQALAARARGGGRGRARRGLPQPLPQHRRTQRRDPLRARRGPAPYRGVRGARAPAVEAPPRACVGCGWTEAPRGMLWHRYRIAADGAIAEAKIVPPTSQNQATIEADLRGFLTGHLELDDDPLRVLCEQAIRNHDPCISCATHFLDLEVERA